MLHYPNDATLTSQSIVESYRHAYRKVYGREPQIMHIFAEWYQVNGEMVHRVALLGEITRLLELHKQQRIQKTDKSIIHRLIAKLRAS
jgi:hypothetical protein